MPRGRASFLLGLAGLGFVSLGLPDGLLGVAWPSLRAGFGLAQDALGALLGAALLLLVSYGALALQRESTDDTSKGVVVTAS